MKKRVKFLLSTVMGCVAAAVSAATVSVDPINGVDEPSASAYKTLTYALAQHGGDTTYNLAAGTYSADSGETFPITLSGLANVALKGVGGQAVLDASKTVDADGHGTRVMVVSASTGVVFENLTITGGDPFSATRESIDGAGSAIYMTEAGDLSLKNCRVTRNTRHCDRSYGVVHCAASFAFSATDCEFSYNECASGESHGDAFSIVGTGPAGTFTNCVFAFNGRNGCTAYGSVIWNYRDGTMFKNCLVYGNYGLGSVYASSGRTATFAGCTIAHNPRTFVSCHTYGCIAMTNTIAWGNGHIYDNRSGKLTDCVFQDGFGGMAKFDPEFYDGYHVPPSNPAYGCGYQYPASAPAPVVTPVYYVDPATGADENVGSSDAPFKTLTAALVKGGVSAEIHLAAGRYDVANGETFPLVLGDRLHFSIIGAGRGQTVVDATDAGGAVFIATNSYDLVFSNLTVTGGYSLTPSTRGFSEAAGFAFERCAEVDLSGCDISGNSAGYSGSAQIWAYGAGLSARYCGDLDFSELSVTNNRILQAPNGQSGGIGLCFVSSSGVNLRNCEVLDNAAISCDRDIYGGGICFAGSSAYVEGFNLLVARNSAVTGTKSGGYGGGICGWDGSSFNLRNCTISDNVGTGLYHYNGTIKVSDSVIWGNMKEVGYSSGTRYWTNCCTSATLNGTVVAGQVTEDPAFIGTTYYVKDTSPVVNAGSVPAADLDFGARTILADGSPDTGVLDIGYHSVWTGPISAVTDLYISPAGDDEKGGRTEDTPVRTLTQALKLAEKGTVFHIKAGTYNTAAGEVFPLDLSNSKALSLVGEDEVILDASGSGQRVITATGANGLLLKGLTITGGHASGSTENAAGCCGGGVYAGGAVITFEDCVITRNYVQASNQNPFGGGVYANGAAALLTFRNCEISFNDTNAPKAPIGVGLCLRDGASASLTDCIVRYNSAEGRTTEGGAFAVWRAESKLTLDNCLVYGNCAARGAFLYTEYTPVVTILGSTIARNVGPTYTGSAANVTLSGSIVWGNGRAFTPKSAEESVIQGGFGGAADVDPVFTNGYRVASPVVAAMGCGYTYPKAAEGAHGEYFVSPSGDDAATGDGAHPLRSLTAAFAKEGPKTIHVAAGIYDSAVETFPLDLRSCEGVKIVGEGPDETVISAAGTGAQVLCVSNALGLVLSGLGITGGDQTSTAGLILASGLPIRASTDVVVTNCAVIANRSTRGTNPNHTYGIGVSAAYCGRVELDGCTVADNAQYGTIGNYGVYGIGFGILETAETIVRNCVFTGNKAEGYCNYRMRGAAIDAVGIPSGGDTLDVFNTLIAKNSSSDTSGNMGYGAVTLTKEFTVNVRNSTIAENIGPGIYREGGTLNVKDSIVYGNVDDVVGTLNSLSYCDIGDGDAGEGCFSADPGFVGTTYLVAADSPVLDKGSDTAEAFSLGEPWGVRVDAVCDTGVVDLGYHQRDIVPPEIITDLFVSPNGSDDNKGTTAEAPLRTLTKALAKAEANVTIHVIPATYGCQSGETFPLVISGVNGVNVQAEGGHAVLDAVDATNCAFVADSALRFRLSNLVFANAHRKNDTGGGLEIRNSSGVLENCTVTNCVVDMNDGVLTLTSGGGATIRGSSVSLTNCVFTHNRTTATKTGNPRSTGAALYICGGSTVDMMNCQIVSNKLFRASFGMFGSAIGIEYNAPTTASTLLMRNCLVVGNGCSNASYTPYAALEAAYGTMMLENCTLTGNPSSRGAVENAGPDSPNKATVSVVNSILYGNGEETNGVMTVDHSLIGVDPRFRRPAKGDYRLRGSSPCIDTGLNADWMKSAVDLKGDPRIRCGIVDMGCYECPASGLMLMVR